MQSTADRRSEKLTLDKPHHFTVALSCFDIDELCHSLVEDGCFVSILPVEEKTKGVKLPFSTSLTRSSYDLFSYIHGSGRLMLKKRTVG